MDDRAWWKLYPLWFQYTKTQREFLRACHETSLGPDMDSRSDYFSVC